MLKKFTSEEKKFFNKNKVFPIYYNEAYEYQMKAQREIEEEKRRKKEEQERQDEKTKTDLNKWIFDEKINLNKKLFKKHFNFQNPSDMLILLNKTNARTKNSELVNIINSGLEDLKEEIKNMSKKEIKVKNPDKIVEIVEMILKFNKQNQQGKGLKILTPNQMLSRLPIALAQLEAGNNSEKLKNEIRQLLYSLYRSKNMTKQVYNNLINYI